MTFTEKHNVKSYSVFFEELSLRKSGKPMHDEFDLMIGATAIENKLTLISDNEKDFERLEGILIDNWFKRK